MNPEEIRGSHLKSKLDRENYINTIYESEDDPAGMAFVVGVNRRRGRLDFRTAIIPTRAYLKNLRMGKMSGSLMLRSILPHLLPSSNVYGLASHVRSLV